MFDFSVLFSFLDISETDLGTTKTVPNPGKKLTQMNKREKKKKLFGYLASSLIFYWYLKDFFHLKNVSDPMAATLY